MSDEDRDPPTSPVSPQSLSPLLEAVRGLILHARQRVLSAANAAQVLTYWEIGRHIVEYEQGGESRAAYGKGLLPGLAVELTRVWERV